MALAIQWTGPLGPATTEREEPIETLQCALELLGRGYADVIILDLSKDGKAYSPKEFAQYYSEAGK